MLAAARALVRSTPALAEILPAFAQVLKFVTENYWLGGCHDTSAALYMLLRESGIDATLCIGEVGVGEKFFDHSWVEAEGLIFDAAVCMPHPRGEHVGGPVFASVDLDTGEATPLKYGAVSGEGLGSEAVPALMFDLATYASVQPDSNIWMLSVALAARMGIDDPRFADFQEKYGAVRRDYRRS